MDHPSAPTVRWHAGMTCEYGSGAFQNSSLHTPKDWNEMLPI
jgi:hypothetical protein